MIAVFEGSPALVVGTLESVAQGFRAGGIRSPWAVLRSRLTSMSPAADLVVTDESERDRAIARAEQLLRNVGHEIDRDYEVVNMLFVDPGERAPAVLERWADDVELRERMLSYWRELRRKVAA